MQVNLWGLDAIKTKGESVAIVLHLLGARPLSEGASAAMLCQACSCFNDARVKHHMRPAGTGRIARFELVPLEELQPPGRPRVDALCNMSGIFRDSFQNVVCSAPSDATNGGMGLSACVVCCSRRFSRWVLLSMLCCSSSIVR